MPTRTLPPGPECGRGIRGAGGPLVLSPGGRFFLPPGAVHVLSHSGRAASIVSGEGRWAVFLPGGGIDDVYGLLGGIPMPTRTRPPGPECGRWVRGAGGPLVLSPGGRFCLPPGAVYVLSHPGRAASIVSGEGRWAVFFLSGV